MIKTGLLEKAVKEYNKYHGAEAHVKVLKKYRKAKDHLLVEFEGPFCFSCAPDEYYADFQASLEETVGFKFRINSIKQKRNGAIVDFEYVEKEPAVVYLSHF